MTGVGNLAFIVGHYKSGSTWLVNLLSLHPRVRGVAETSIFPYATTHDDINHITHLLYSVGYWGRGGMLGLARHRLAEWSRPLRSLRRPILGPRDRPTTRMDLSLLDQIALRRTLLCSTSKEDYCRRFFQFLSESLQPQGYLVEKNNNITIVPFIRSVFPDAKLIAIYRDGRDVVVSEKFFLKNEAGRERPFTDSVLNWRRAMEAQLRYADEHGVYTLSYESLLQNGEVVVRDLLRFLDLPSDPGTIRDMLEKSSFKFITGRDTGVENARSFFRKGTSGDWRNHFTEEDKRTFKELAGDVLTRLRYERDLAW